MKISALLSLFSFLIIGTFAGISTARAACEATMKTGKYRGQCIDLSGKKSPVLVFENSQILHIKNFRHEGKFFEVEIPYRDIQKVSYVVVDLNSKPLNTGAIINISHTQLRFKLKPHATVHFISGTPTKPVDDFLMSMNYMAPKGVSYDPKGGFDEGLYASVLQIFSMQDEVKNRFLGGKLNMFEIDLDLNSLQAAALLKTYIEEADRVQYSIPYDTWTSNCTTLLFDVVDKALGLDIKPYRFTLSKIRDTGLIPGIRALGRRGLLDDNSAIKIVNREFGFLSFPSKSNRYFFPFLNATYREIK